MSVFQFGVHHYKKYSFGWTVCLILGQLVIVIGLLFPLIVQLIIDYIVNYDPNIELNASNPFNFLVSGKYGDPQTWQLFLTLAIIFVAMMFLRHTMHYVRFNWCHRKSVRFENELRSITFNKLLTQNHTILGKYSVGDLMTILNNDVIQFKELFGFTIPFIVDRFFIIGISAFILFGIHPYLALTLIASSPVLAIASIKFIKRSREVSDVMRNSSAELGQVVQENINGVRIVRSLAKEAYEIEKFDKANIGFKEAYFNHAKMTSKYTFIFNLIKIITYLTSVAIAAYFTAQGAVSVGGFVAYTSYMLLVMDSITSLVSLLFQTQQFMVAGRRIYNFINVGDVISNCDNPKTVTESPLVKFNDFTMMMDDKIVLKDINLVLKPGKKLGVMGGTGSGKSLLLKSLTRYYDPYQGNITINGDDIRQLDLENLREQFAIVFQDVFLFSDTIDSNIAYYDNEISSEKVIEVAKIAKAHDFILKTEDGYDTVVGENGIGLSGGQKQRISIARALLKNAPVLLLDSATSALDHETELDVMRDIESYCKDTSIIIATHRATSVEKCDEIIYLDNGEIIERGTHEELLALGGKYSITYRLQAGEEVEFNG